MTLTHPWLALGVLLGAVPVILHLAARRRYRVIPWAATDILAKALENQAPRVRRADRLLLAVRVLILAAAALTLARPAMPRPEPPAWAGLAPPAAVVIVDRSGSMQTGAGGRTRIAAARDRARELVAAMPAGTRAGLIGMDDRALPLTAGLDADRQRLLASVDRLAASARNTELHPALALALRWLKDLSAQQKTIYLITDAQESLFTQDAAATRAVLARALPEIRLVVLPVEPLDGPSASITDLEIVTPSSPTGAPATIRVKLAGGVIRDTAVGVDLWIDSRKADHRLVRMKNGSGVCLFEPVAAEPGLHQAEARLDPNAGRLDNRRYAAWYTPAAMDVLIATRVQDNPNQPSAYVYLQAALEALADTGLPWVVRPAVRPVELARALDERVWLLILADCGPLPAEAVGDISRFVERGGACWLSGGRDLDETLASLQADTSSAAAWSSVLRLGPPDTQPSSPAITSIKLHRSGPQFAGSGPIEAGPDGPLAALAAVNLLEVQPIEPATDSPWSVALRTTAGEALLLTHASHRLAILTTSLNPGTSDWPYRPALVCLVDDLARWLCRPRLVAGSVYPGFKWQEPPPAPAGRYALITPAGQRILPAEPADCILEEPGIYRWQADQSPPDARRALTVNVDPGECRGPAWSPVQITAWLPPGGHCVIGPETVLQRSSAGPRTETNVELWPALATLLLALLAAEAVLAHWFTPAPTAVACLEVPT